MREFLLDAVTRYLEETGEKSLSAARTPYFPENFSPKECERQEMLALGLEVKTAGLHRELDVWSWNDQPGDGAEIRGSADARAARTSCVQAHQAQVPEGQHSMPPGSRDGLLSRVAALPPDRADLDRRSTRNSFRQRSAWAGQFLAHVSENFASVFASATLIRFCRDASFLEQNASFSNFWWAPDSKATKRYDSTNLFQRLFYSPSSGD